MLTSRKCNSLGYRCLRRQRVSCRRFDSCFFRPLWSKYFFSDNRDGVRGVGLQIFAIYFPRKVAIFFITVILTSAPSTFDRCKYGDCCRMASWFQDGKLWLKFASINSQSRFENACINVQPRSADALRLGSYQLQLSIFLREFQSRISR